MIYSGANYHFWVINDHFGGPSVHCGQILQCQHFGNIWSPNPSLRSAGKTLVVVKAIKLRNWEAGFKFRKQRRALTFWLNRIHCTVTAGFLFGTKIGGTREITLYKREKGGDPHTLAKGPSVTDSKGPPLGMWCIVLARPQRAKVFFSLTDPKANPRAMVTGYQ